MTHSNSTSNITNTNQQPSSNNQKIIEGKSQPQEIYEFFKKFPNFEGETMAEDKKFFDTLIDNKELLNSQDSEKNNALHIAIINNDKTTALKLISAGIDYLAKNKDNLSALDLAREKAISDFDFFRPISSEEQLQLNKLKFNAELIYKIFKINTEGQFIANLLQRGKQKSDDDLDQKGDDDLDQKNTEKTSQALSFFIDHPESLSFFIDHRQILNSPDESGNNALHLALLKKDFKTAEKLILFGIDNEAKNSEGLSARDLARSSSVEFFNKYFGEDLQTTLDSPFSKPQPSPTKPQALGAENQANNSTSKLQNSSAWF